MPNLKIPSVQFCFLKAAIKPLLHNARNFDGHAWIGQSGSKIYGRKLYLDYVVSATSIETFCPLKLLIFCESTLHKNQSNYQRKRVSK
jgi:hypothetical protein